jgi:hypothetical protein
MEKKRIGGVYEEHLNGVAIFLKSAFERIGPRPLKVWQKISQCLPKTPKMYVLKGLFE